MLQGARATAATHTGFHLTMPGMLLYVSLTGHGKIVAFEREIDPATGATIGLAMTHEVPCPEPGALATDPAGRFLFAATGLGRVGASAGLHAVDRRDGAVLVHRSVRRRLRGGLLHR